MAKTTSQIIAENKIKRAEAAAIAASRDKIHQQQMAGVAEESAARTAAVLNKAGIKTKTNPNTYEVSIAGDSTPRSKETRQRLDLQKKKEDRLEAKNPVDSLQIKKDRTKKEYDEYVSSDDYRKKQAESVRDQQRAMDQDESQNFAPTSDFGAFPAAQDAMEARLRQEKERAESEFNAREDRETFGKGMAEIDAMSEEDLVLLDEYVRNRDNRQDVFANNISWFLSNKKEGDALKALAEKYGEEKALQLAEIYGMNLHEQNAKAAEEQGKAGVNDGWISATAHNLLGIPARAFGNISGFMGRLNAETNRTGQFHGLPTYTAGDELSAYGDAVTGQTAQNIEGDVYDENGNLIEDGGALRKVASWGYQGAMSIADSTARLAMSGGNSAIASAIAGMGTFNQSMQKYSAMGASPEQAYTAATMSAGIEYVTEKLPMDEALKLLRSGGDPGVVRKVLTQAFLVEPSTEEVNLFANMAMETKVLGEKSGKEQRIGDLIAGGLTRDQAEQQFWKETWMQAAETYAVSAFAGLIGGGGAAYAGNQMQQAQDQQQIAVDPAGQVQQETGTSAGLEQKKQDNARRMQEYAADRKTMPETIAKAIENRWYREMSMDSGSAEFSERDVQAVLADPEAVAWMQARGLDPADIASLEDVDHERYQLPGEVAFAVLQQQDPAVSLQQEAAPVLTEAEQAQQALNSVGAALAESAPAPVEDAPVSEQQQNLRAAIESVTGTGWANSQNPNVTWNRGRLYPRTDDSAQIGTDNFNKNPQNSVDSGTNRVYTNSRSPQVQGAIDQLNNGGDLAPTIDEIMAIPEIAEAERANEGPETINLPNREQIRENGYQQAMQKGSWDGKDYAGEVRQERRMDIVIGLPGSGKSSVYTERLSQEHKSRVIDTDDFREYIPEYNGSNASVVHEESSEIRDRVFDTALDNGDNILLSTIGANAEKLAKQIAAYKEDGYQVYLHLNELPNNKSLARAIGRYISEDGKLGRYVSPKLIAEYGDKPTQTYLYLTGQGGNRDGELDGDLRTGRGSASGNAAETGGAAQGPAGAAVPADLLAGYDWYNNDVARGEPPRLIQTSDDGNVNASAVSPQTEDSGNLPPAGGQGTAASNPDYRDSNTYLNTGLRSTNANIRAGYRQELRQDPTAARYKVKHNADTLAEAQSRTGSPENNAAALQDLLNRDHWTPEDVATSTLLLDQIMASGDKAAIDQLNALRQKRKEAGTYSGQVAQSFAIHNPTMKAADSPATAVDTFRANLDGLKQEETTWNPKKGVDFETWKNEIKDDVDRIGIQIACVEDGDTDSMRKIILQIANRRGTTAWFGRSQRLGGNAWSVLKKLDFQDLKKVANTQLVAMADDYRARGAGEVAKGLRKQNMLSSLKTFVRNISGNVVGSFADSVSESGAGRMADAVLSKFTGKQTMGSDILRAGTYAKAAKEAGQFASLCVELNIPIETDVDSSYSAAAGNSGNNKYLGKTFRATGNPAMRALYAYQKYMSYALEVSDKIFEGGTNAAVAESLNRLQGANLTEEEVGALADFTGNRRTFKNATWEEDGKTKGSTLARKASNLQNELGIVGEVAMPFVSTPMNVTQTGIDYTAGVVKGLGEMVSIIMDAKAGKTIPVERQRQAASDFGRGVTGTAMIAMFASAAAMGALKVSNSEDWDKEALAQAEGRSGAQINWSALQRGMNGEDAKWQSGDIISGMDFLEPFNTQMYLGAELSQADDFNLLTGADATIKSVWQSLMDSPVMTGLADIEQTLNDISEAESTEDAVNVAAGYAGDVASSYVPQFVRQIAQNQDGYYRDTRGENALDSAINSFLAAIPGQSEKLPIKYSGLGEAQKRGSAMETFLDPTATHEFQQNEVTTFLDELSGKVGESANNIYPDRQAPMKFTYGDDWEVKLDGKMRETYQKTYGEKVNELYQSLMNNPDFQGFSDDLKIKSLEEAKSYATRYAKAAVSDYREVPNGSADSLAKGIINQQVRSQFGSLFTALDTHREYGYSTEGTAAKLEKSFQAYQDLSRQTQKEILEQATSDTAKYLEVRAKGISTEMFVETTERIGNLKIQPEFKEVRPAQEFQVIAGMNISDSAKDILMKAWMEDYDPSVREKDRDTSELKYDYARNELGMSVAEYVDGYDIYTYEKKIGGEGTADRTRERMEKELDITKAEAKALYKLYGGKLNETLIELYG